MSDLLGERMQAWYEDRAQVYLPRRTYVIMRLDIKGCKRIAEALAFEKPFDIGFCQGMDETAAALCRNINGSQLAYVQNDEINVLVTDFARAATEPWAGYSVQRMCSMSASMATGTLTQWLQRSCSTIKDMVTPVFEVRVFAIPDPVEVANYFVHRQKVCARGAAQVIARQHYSDDELRGRTAPELQAMIVEKGDNWGSYNPRFIYGGLVEYQYIQEQNKGVWRVNTSAPAFTADQGFLPTHIPEPGYGVKGER